MCYSRKHEGESLLDFLFVNFSKRAPAPRANEKWEMKNDKWKICFVFFPPMNSHDGRDRQECLSYLVMPLSLMNGLMAVITISSITSTRQERTGLSFSFGWSLVWYQTWQLVQSPFQQKS